jgi:hypothetical protein
MPTIVIVLVQDDYRIGKYGGENNITESTAFQSTLKVQHVCSTTLQC